MAAVRDAHSLAMEVMEILEGAAYLLQRSRMRETAVPRSELLIITGDVAVLPTLDFIFGRALLNLPFEFFPSQERPVRVTVSLITLPPPLRRLHDSSA